MDTDAHGLVLAYHAQVQPVLHLHHFFHFPFHQSRHRNAGPLGHHRGDILGVHLLLEHARAAGVHLGEALFGVGALGFQIAQRAVAQPRGRLQIGAALGLLDLQFRFIDLLLDGAHRSDRLLFLLPLAAQPVRFLVEIGELFFDSLQPLAAGFVAFLAQRLALDLELHDLPVHGVQRLRLGIDLGAHARGGLVDQVDGLVGQAAVGDVALRKRGGRDHGRVGDAHAVVEFVLLFEPAQDRDRILNRRLFHHHRLEAALQGGVLFHVLAVFVEGGGADQVQFAAREHRLEHVAGVHRALGRPRPDHRVQLVHEQDHPPVGFGHFL